MNKKLYFLLFATFQTGFLSNAKSTNAFIDRAILDRDGYLNETSTKWPLSGLTFYSNRPLFQSASPERTVLFRDRSLARDCGIGGAFQIVPLGGRSTKRTKLGQWFSFNNLPVLTVAEDQAPGSLVDGNSNPNFRDVNAIHFNIQTEQKNFKSVFGFQPVHSFAGVGLEYRQYLHPRAGCEKKWWFELATAVVWIQNDMNITESIVSPGAPINENVNKNIKEAFKGQKGFFNITTTSVSGSKWQFGKIAGAKSDVNLTDIQLKLGYDFLCEDNYFARGYLGGVIPASNKSNGEFLFEPITGNNFHGGIMWGGSCGYDYWSQGNHCLSIIAETNWRYLFKNTQTRTISVKKKPWSQYMLVFRNFAEAQSNIATEGINIFTQKVNVRPRFNADFNFGFLYSQCILQIEGGYNLWLRQGEKVTLKNEFNEEPAFVNVSNGVTNASTINRAITISENFGGSSITVNEQQYNLNRIMLGNLNLKVAAHPATIQHTIYSSIGGRWDDRCFPIFAGIGASYSFSALNTAINKWMIWGKFGLSV